MIVEVLMLFFGLFPPVWLLVFSVRCAVESYCKNKRTSTWFDHRDAFLNNLHKRFQNAELALLGHYYRKNFHPSARYRSSALRLMQQLLQRYLFGLRIVQASMQESLEKLTLLKEAIIYPDTQMLDYLFPTNDLQVNWN